MPEFFLGNRSVTLQPSHVIGKGGEADIYRKGTEAFKVFKQPSHPDLNGSPQQQEEARQRIAEHQLKLPAFPRNLPSKVSTPGELLRDKKGTIVGFQMNFIENVEVLYQYGQRDFRDHVSDDTVRGVFADLYKTVADVHKAGVVIGDFNDLNVLVRGTDAFIIDADSMQFGNFPARMFTATFVDPLICDQKASAPMMVGNHSPNTDWYAYLVMLMRSLLYVGPYGGVFRPKEKKRMIPHDTRPLRRITVFDKEIIYPRPARQYDILPDSLLDYLRQTFEKDRRGTPPLSLVENLRFTTCSKCGLAHARASCPVCVGVTAPMLKEVHTGTVKAKKFFETGGSLLHVTMQHGWLRYLYHDGTSYRREGGREVIASPLNAQMRFRISGSDTLIAHGGRCLVFNEKDGNKPGILSVDMFNQLPIVDANGEAIFYAEGDGLWKTSSDPGLDYREQVGGILENQTLFWVGDTLGFGFYRASELSNFFIFRPQHRGLNDSVKLPPIRGQLVDSTCVFGKDRIWFFTTTQEGSRTYNRCFLLDERGMVLGTAEGTPGDGTWLGGIRGTCAVGDFLLVPTDGGVVRVAQSGTSLSVAKEFPDTQRFVDSNSRLFIDKDGLYVCDRHTIWQLVMG